MAANVDNAIKDFLTQLSNERVLFQNDTIWSGIATGICLGKDENFQEVFWEKLESIFLEKEKTFGHCHKGQIFWRRAIIFLEKGEISQSLLYLDKAVKEDRIRGDNFSAAIGLQSVINPLLNRYKQQTGKLEFDREISEFYETLTGNEKKKFAINIGSIHDQIISSRLTVIKPNFFDLISSAEIRAVVKDIYDEITQILVRKPAPTNYSSVFATGAVLEGMLDDLYERDDKKVWKIFRRNKDVQSLVKKGTQIDVNEYQANFSLGQKVKVLEFMARKSCSPIYESTILLMKIIEEYRNLIHSKRALTSPFKPDGYIASFLFLFIGIIASDLWPANVDSRIRTNAAALAS